MRRRSFGGPWRAVSVVLALVVTVAIDGAATGPSAASVQAQLTPEMLRGGGYVIFLRHGFADQGQDAGRVDVDDCTTQRNLNDSGVRDARTIGDAVRRLQIPVDTVLTSEFCRARETALIAFERAQRWPMLNFCCADGYDATLEQRGAWLNELLATPPRPGTNTVLVGHGVYVVTDIAQGEAAIYRPDGVGGTIRVARILPSEWNLPVYPGGGPR